MSMKIQGLTDYTWNIIDNKGGYHFSWSQYTASLDPIHDLSASQVEGNLGSREACFAWFFKLHFGSQVEGRQDPCRVSQVEGRDCRLREASSQVEGSRFADQGKIARRSRE